MLCGIIIGETYDVQLIPDYVIALYFLIISSRHDVSQRILLLCAAMEHRINADYIYSRAGNRVEYVYDNQLGSPRLVRILQTCVE